MDIKTLKQELASAQAQIDRMEAHEPANPQLPFLLEKAASLEWVIAEDEIAAEEAKGK